MDAFGAQVPTASPSGSGPLSSLRESNESFSSLSELKSAGNAAAVMRSNASPLSNRRCPEVVQIEKERAPNVKSRS
jgi:hypothetical protein